MTMHKALHPRDDVDKLYASRKEGGRVLASIQDSIDASIRRLEEYIEKVQRKSDYCDQKQYSIQDSIDVLIRRLEEYIKKGQRKTDYREQI